MRTFLLVMMAALLASGCTREAAHDGTEHGAVPAAAAAAEGMCAEHGVLEAVCTKCKPGLIPVFQAKGDWCAEHGFPESFCPICHPDRGGKPAGAEGLGKDEPPPDGLVVRLKGPDAEANAGFVTARAELAPSEDVITAVARIEAGPRHRAEVAARAEAIVAKLLVDVGDRVSEGQALAALQGPAGESARARVDAAEARAAKARAQISSERKLKERGISSERDVLAAEQEVAEAEGELAAARAGLSLVGGRDQRLASPLAGVVTKRSANIGQLVQAGDILFEVADLSGVDALADVREELLASIAAGREAEVLVVAASPDPFPAVVESVAPVVDPLTRTGQVRLHVPNEKGLLRPGMSAEARLHSATRPDVVLVPRDAIQQARGASLAFVRKELGVFETRRVTLGAAHGDRIEITKGLSAGEDVVTTGSFLLKTETLPGAIGSGCCEVKEPGE